MKIKSLSFVFLIMFSLTGKSQAPEKTGRFSDLKLFYNSSFIISPLIGEESQINKETLIPYCAGVEFSINLNKRFSADLGVIFKTSGLQKKEGFIMVFDGGDHYTGPVYSESKRRYLDIPFHLNYKLLNTLKFNILVSSGPKLTFGNDKAYYNPDSDGKESKYKRNDFGAGIDFGLVTSFKFTERIGLFASQYYGKYLIDDLFNIEYRNLDFNIGLIYYINN